MEAQYLLDTVILVDHLNGIAKATQWLSHLKAGEAVISVVTRAEILVGTEPQNEAMIKLWLDQYLCLEISQSIADEAAGLRKKYKWKLPNAFQAALALRNKLSLVTRNTKDFVKERHHFVKIPYKL